MGGCGSERARGDGSPAFHRSTPPPDHQPPTTTVPNAVFPIASAPRRDDTRLPRLFPRYIQHRFRLHFDFPVFVFRPQAPQHVHFILQAGREKYAYSGDSGGSDHYYIGIGNGGSGDGGGCSKNIVIIII
ncbi:hypothetical protein ACI65C_000878 [Semiaphis heraclei]